LLADLPAAFDGDRYGAGGVVAELEEETARLLGKPAAVFMPSGTMAQQIALRVHADRSGRRGTAFHPACHLLHHEELGYHHLHGLQEVIVGDASRPLGLEDILLAARTPENIGTLLLELPQRDLGGRMPEYEELLEQVALARSRGWAVHLDGARIWEAAAGYGRSPAELANLFDTVYVSFYKGLGAIAGCCLAGPEDVIAEARTWRTRHGGRLVALWPYAASAKAALALRLPRMPSYRDRALAIAQGLLRIPAVVVLPQPPQTSMMHLVLPIDLTTFEQRVAWLATERGIWTWGAPFPGAFGSAALGVRVELTVGDATVAIDVAEVVGAIGYLASGDSSALEPG
jgi:threonine aldolase